MNRKEFEESASKKLEDSAFLLRRKMNRTETRIETLILSAVDRRYDMLNKVLEKSHLRFHPIRITDVAEVEFWHQSFARAGFYILDLTGIDVSCAEKMIQDNSVRMENRVIILNSEGPSRTLRERFGSIVEWFGNGVSLDLERSPIPSVIQNSISAT